MVNGDLWYLVGIWCFFVLITWCHSLSSSLEECWQGELACCRTASLYHSFLCPMVVNRYDWRNMVIQCYDRHFESHWWQIVLRKWSERIHSLPWQLTTINPGTIRPRFGRWGWLFNTHCYPLVTLTMINDDDQGEDYWQTILGEPTRYKVRITNNHQRLMFCCFFSSVNNPAVRRF